MISSSEWNYRFGRHRGIGPERVPEVIEHEVGDRKAVLDRFDPERCRQVALPHAGWAEEEDVRLLPDEAAGRQRLDLPPVDPRQKGPIEVLEGFPGRQGRELEHRRRAPFVLPIEFARSTRARGS
jgi:hypothetical protein